MNMRKRSGSFMAIVLLLMVICLAVPQVSQSSTIITVNPGGTFVDIASFQFTITSSAIANDFIGSLPVGPNYPTDPDDRWSLFKGTGKIVSAFDATGALSLPSGPIGSFASDTTLGSWVFGNQASVSFVQGVDYFVTLVGTNYVVSGSAVPIPAAAWLLGSGLLGLVAIRRRMKK
jgi:hypothetical protein